MQLTPLFTIVYNLNVSVDSRTLSNMQTLEYGLTENRNKS